MDVDKLVHHSDAGSQYTSFRFTQHLLDAGIDASIGTVGDALDNALAESTIGLYKTELIKPNGPWHNIGEVDVATQAWVDWYNNRRLHGACGGRPPTEFEALYEAGRPDQSGRLRLNQRASTEPGAVHFRSWSIVAEVRGLRCSATSRSRRCLVDSASRAAFGPGGITSVST